ACRDNPYSTATRSLSRGLAPVKAPAGTLIAFATGPGQVALDGRGPNSPYSGALSQSILEFGVPLEETFRRTRRLVLEATGRKQVPWEHSSLTGEFFFRPKIAEPEARVAATSDVEKSHLAELAEWSRIKDTGDVATLRQHMQRFPDGMFRELAALKIERLSVPQSPWSMTVTGSVTTVATRNEQIDTYEQGLKIESAAPDAAGYAEAAALYRKAAERGLAQATYRLARLYDKGLGVGQDRKEAARLYAEAAEKGFAPAMSALATMREFGEAGPRDMPEALRLYRQAAEAGDATAMTSLGYLHDTGKGVVRDAAAARRWYSAAVALGDTRAMFNLALMTMRGGGGTLVEAVRLLENAAERGHAGARRELAFLYDEGRGVARNPERAATHLLAALEAGDEGAARDALQRTNAWSYATRRAIQRQLTSRGLYRGEAHGVFNHSTKTALRRVASGS
ncbi:MAG: caspase family protein, partial [Hyphomicrobiaceae bacterium]